MKCSASLNVYENLAYEELLMEYVENRATQGKECYGFFLWQSENAIVLGRNQNAFHECNFQAVNEYGTTISRRKSGGGAVYQDEGNLNFTFIAPETIYSLDFNNQVIINMLRMFDVPAVFSGRNDIIVEGYKVSGSAYRKKNKIVMHHGTLLVSSDLEKVEKLLTPDSFKLKSKGIASVSSRVKNICDFADNISVKMIKEKLLLCYEEMLRDSFLELCKHDCKISNDKVINLEKQLSSKRWIMREPLDYGRVIKKNWGILKYFIVEKDSCISEILYETDALDIELFDELFQHMTGIGLSRIELIEFKENYVKTRSSEQVKIIYDIIDDIVGQIRSKNV